MEKTEYEKMDPDMKAKWLEALRSGEYEQGSRRLEYDGQFCCLGVLNKVCDLKHPGTFAILYKNPDEPCAGEYLIDAKAQHKLWALNDGSGGVGEGRHNFLQIADWIEENL